MKNVATYGDSWVLFNMFQKFSTWSQKTLGLTNFWWTRFFAIIAFIAMTVDSILAFRVDAYAWVIFFQIIWLLCLLICFLEVHYLCLRLDDKYVKGHKYANKRAKTLVTRRILWSVLNVWNLIAFAGGVMTKGGVGKEVLITVAMVIIPICLYFVSCTPLPPSQSKVGKLIKKAKGKVQEIFLPSPEPCPITSRRAR